MKKRGLSPVIATVLLVAMVVVIGLIVFLWIRGFIEEPITKFGDRNIKLVCEDVQFEASYSDSTEEIYVSNLGNVPIFNIKLKIFDDKSHSTEDLSKLLDENWPDEGLLQGSAVSGDISSHIKGITEKIILIPVLLGNSKEGKKTFTCEDQYGYEIILE